jgi:phosphomannomutase
MTNSGVSDSITNLLMVECALRDKDLSMKQFLDLYRESPNKIVTVNVKDRTQFKCDTSGTKLSQPQLLQDVIDFFAKEAKEGRCFVWPSETQNHLNVYCEAATDLGVDYLALEVTKEIENKYINYDYEAFTSYD